MIDEGPPEAPNQDSSSGLPSRKRKHALPEWYTDKKGKQRLRTGRWNMQRVAEYLIAHPEWQTVDELARVVYSASSKLNRISVRKHIPLQRRFMLAMLEQPIVTQFGERGRIMKVKLYNKLEAYDRELLRTELDHARAKREISEKRYRDLMHAFFGDSLPDGVPVV